MWRGLRRIGPVVLTATLSGVIGALGFLLLVVPGLIATVVMFVAIPACVIERLAPIRSIRRSAALTRGCRWQIFAVLAAIVVVSVIVNWLIGALTPGAPSWLLPAVAFGWMVLVNGYEAVLAAVIYYDLRIVKDQLDADRIAAVFD